MLIAIAIAEGIQGSKRIALVPEPRKVLLQFSAPHVSIVFEDHVILSVDARRPKEVLRWQAGFWHLSIQSLKSFEILRSLLQWRWQ